MIASLVVVVDELPNRCPEAIRTERDHQANVVFERPRQALDVTDGLGVMGSGAQMPQAVSPQEVTHRPRDITTAIVRQQSRPDQVRRLLQVTGLYRLLDSACQAGRLYILD